MLKNKVVYTLYYLAQQITLVLDVRDVHIGLQS